MRHVPLVLSAALFALAPALAFGVDAPATAPAAPQPAASTATPAPAATPAEPAAPAKSFSDAQRTEIEAIIKDYLVTTNPQVLMEAMQALQKKEMADASAKSKTAISSEHEKIYNDPTTPVGGNPKGDVTVVEFFDYQCGYCKMSEPAIEKLLKEDKNVKFLYKDFPILGPTSTVAAKAALAAAKQGKYIQFHDALMGVQFSHNPAKQAEDEDKIYKAAKTLGLNVDKLKKDMTDDSVIKVVDENVALGTGLGARGTPTFIIADDLYPGALQYDDLKKAVDAARAAPPKKQ